jgi:hypothetical protein
VGAHSNNLGRLVLTKSARMQAVLQQRCQDAKVMGKKANGQRLQQWSKGLGIIPHFFDTL